ncbi:PRA1 domain-containing protein, partial [Cephalotus follicularis]
SPPPTSTYTTIPISFADVISRSIDNLSSTIYRHHRPWPQFLSFGSLARPDSISSCLTRTRINLRYFAVNYSLLITTCGALSLIGSPLSLLSFSLILSLWLILYFFREDPIHHVSDRVVFVGLLLASALWVWVNGVVVVRSLFLGVGIGVFICFVHGLLRSPDGLSLDEYRRLIVSAPAYGSVSSDHG